MENINIYTLANELLWELEEGISSIHERSNEEEEFLRTIILEINNRIRRGTMDKDGN